MEKEDVQNVWNNRLGHVGTTGLLRIYGLETQNDTCVFTDCNGSLLFPLYSMTQKIYGYEWEALGLVSCFLL